MEEIQAMEQPQESFSQGNVSEQITEEVSVPEDKDFESGSTFGKFKDATSLLNAYNSLQKEFTRKSQKLAELLKSGTATEPSTIVTNSQRDTQSVKEEISNKEINETKISQPIYKQSNWKNQVVKFFEENPEAKSYSKQISETLLKDKNLASSENCLSYAYALAKQKSYKEPAELLTDQKYIEDFASNEKIREQVLKSYLSSIKSGKSSPKLIAGDASNISPAPPCDKPKTLKEASNMLKKLLQA